MFDQQAMEEFLDAYVVMRKMMGNKCEFIKSEAFKTMLYAIEEDVMVIEFFYYIETGNVTILQTIVSVDVIDKVRDWCLIKHQKVKFIAKLNCYKISGFKLKDLDELMEYFGIISDMKEVDCV